MELAKAVVYAAVEGVTQVLPLSASGHRVAVAVWLGDVEAGETLSRLGQIGCVVALVIAVRARLGRAFVDGIRGIARPVVLQSQSGGRDATAIAVGSIVAVAVEMALEPFRISMNATPLAVALGLLVSAASLLSTSFAPAPRQLCPSAIGAIVVGLAHGLAVFPGGSRVGAAFVALSWLGVSRWHAVEMAFLITIPSLALSSVQWLVRGVAHPAPPGEAALAIVVGFVFAGLAASFWRSSVGPSAPAQEAQRIFPGGGVVRAGRTAWFGLYLVPLALALVGYGRALPHP